ncbi:MAG: hypothetical protein HFG72_10835 [Hungatella sp.]|nr:hypothetical protein [Hungatella sp.]
MAGKGLPCLSGGCHVLQGAKGAGAGLAALIVRNRLNGSFEVTVRGGGKIG